MNPIDTHTLTHTLSLCIHLMGHSEREAKQPPQSLSCSPRLPPSDQLPSRLSLSSTIPILPSPRPPFFFLPASQRGKLKDRQTSKSMKKKKKQGGAGGNACMSHHQALIPRQASKVPFYQASTQLPLLLAPFLYPLLFFGDRSDRIGISIRLLISLPFSHPTTSRASPSNSSRNRPQ